MVKCQSFYMCLVFCSCSAVVIGHLLLCCSQLTLECNMVYLDYSKAFDSVPYKRLLSKLKSYGIEGKVWSCIEDFLIGRNQMVTVGDAESEWTDVTSGVPQSSILGPILFIIYINNLPENVNSSVKMFADDTKLYRHITTEDNREELQKVVWNLAPEIHCQQMQAYAYGSFKRRDQLSSGRRDNTTWLRGEELRADNLWRL